MLFFVVSLQLCHSFFALRSSLSLDSTVLNVEPRHFTKDRLRSSSDLNSSEEVPIWEIPIRSDFDGSDESSADWSEGQRPETGFGWLPLDIDYMFWEYDKILRTSTSMSDEGDDSTCEAEFPELKSYRRAAQMMTRQLDNGYNEFQAWRKHTEILFGANDWEKSPRCKHFFKDFEHLLHKFISNHEKGKALLKHFTIENSDKLTCDGQPEEISQAQANLMEYKELMDVSGDMVDGIRSAFQVCWKERQNVRPDVDVSKGIQQTVESLVRALPPTTFVQATPTAQTLAQLGLATLKSHRNFAGVQDTLSAAFGKLAEEGEVTSPSPDSALKQYMDIEMGAGRNLYKDEVANMLAARIMRQVEDWLSGCLRAVIVEEYLHREEAPRLVSQILRDEAKAREYRTGPGKTPARQAMLNQMGAFIDDLLQSLQPAVAAFRDGWTEPAVEWIQAQGQVHGEVDVLDCKTGWNVITRLIKTGIPKAGNVMTFALKVRIPVAPPAPAFITISIVGEAAKGIQGHVVGLPMYGSPNWAEVKLTLSIGGEVNFIFASWNLDFQLIIRAAATGVSRAMKGLWYLVYQVLLQNPKVGGASMATWWAGKRNIEHAEIVAAAYESYIYDPDHRGDAAFVDLMVYAKTAFVAGLPNVGSLKFEGGAGMFKRFNAKSLSHVYGDHFRSVVTGGGTHRRERARDGDFPWTARFHFLFEAEFLPAIMIQGMYAQANIVTGGASAWGVWFKTSFAVVKGSAIAVRMLHGAQSLIDIYRTVAASFSKREQEDKDRAGYTAIPANLDLSRVDGWDDMVYNSAQRIDDKGKFVRGFGKPKPTEEWTGPPLDAPFGEAIQSPDWTLEAGMPWTQLEFAFYIGGKWLPTDANQHFTYVRLELNHEFGGTASAGVLGAQLTFKRRLISIGAQKLKPGSPWKTFADLDGSGILPWDDSDKQAAEQNYPQL